MEVIVVDNVTKRYGRRVGIRDLSLRVDAGTIFGFLGPNGAGKTTTIRILLGLLRATEGRAEALGLDCWRDSHLIKRDVSYISGDLRLYPWMTTRNALRIVGQIRGRNLDAPGLELAEYFELDPVVRVRNMSRGMRQKLGLILSLAHAPKLLVLDEPTSALDPPMQQALYDHLRKRATEGATVVFSSHTLSEVEELCDRVAILRDGRLVEDKPLDALRSQANRAVTLEWLSPDVAARTAVPAFLKLTGRNGIVWECDLVGDPMEFVRWGAAQPLADIVMRPPSLERLFHRYYHEEPDTP